MQLKILIKDEPVDTEVVGAGFIPDELDIMLETGDAFEVAANEDEKAELSSVFCWPGVGELDENPVSFPLADAGRPPNNGESLYNYKQTWFKTHITIMMLKI